MRIPLELIKGDVNDVQDIDCLLFGPKCPLKSIVTEETGKTFVRKHRKHIELAFPFEVLDLVNHRWRTLLSVDFRSNNKVTTTQFLKIYFSLLYVLRGRPNCHSIAIMPFSARNPSYVALGTIYSLWLATFYKSDLGLGYENRRCGDVRFKIISDEGTEPYQEVLANGCRPMWEFLESVWRRRDDLPLPVTQFPLRRVDAGRVIRFDVQQVEV